jgi:hypothetical protein
MMNQGRISVPPHIANILIIRDPYIPPVKAEENRKSGCQAKTNKMGEGKTPVPFVPEKGTKEGGDNRQAKDGQDKILGRKQEHKKDNKDAPGAGTEHVPEIYPLDAVPEGDKAYSHKRGNNKKRYTVNNIVGANEPKLPGIGGQENGVKGY